MVSGPGASLCLRLLPLALPSRWVPCWMLPSPSLAQGLSHEASCLLEPPWKAPGPKPGA